jgi:DNA polymerase-4
VEQLLVWRPEHLAAIFGRRGPMIHGLLRGRDDSPTPLPGRKPPVVRLDHEFSEDVNQPAMVEAALWRLAERAGARLRARGRAARRVTLTLGYSDGLRAHGQRSHPAGAANDFIIFDLARTALASAWTRRVRLRHMRLTCSGLVIPSAQMELPFEAAEQRPARGEALLKALDAIRRRHGAGAIQLGRGLGIRP